MSSCSESLFVTAQERSPTDVAHILAAPGGAMALPASSFCSRPSCGAAHSRGTCRSRTSSRTHSSMH